MERILSKVGLVLLLSFLIVPFNNCGQYQEEGRIDSSSCGEYDCEEIRPFLELQITQPSTDPYILPATNNFTIQGLCTKVAFTSSLIVWEIYNSEGSVVLNSNMAGPSYVANCSANDQFSISVAVPCPGGNGICTGINQNYAVAVSLFGVDDDGDPHAGTGDHKKCLRISPAGPSSSGPAVCP